MSGEMLPEKKCKHHMEGSHLKEKKHILNS